ncbi:MAG: alpha-ketoacid dehydrogenase subunit beta [Oscillospiraceae bacterium]|nr:alpha-ketoacid dehydrogenase subunit beta [Oscillospiraceae bacterium]
MKKIHMLDAVNEAIHEEMARDDKVFVIAEDVGEYGGVWNATRGLYEKYGAIRAMDTPISEAGFTGLCVGAAMAGLRPVTEIMYMDFITACMDQLVNQAAKADLMSGWQMELPITLRAQYGSGSREAAQHSQSLEGWFCQVPGFKVIIPSNAYDAKGLLKSAIRDNTPCIFMENRNLYYDPMELPDEEYLIPLGKANIKQQGNDLTIVTYGIGVPVCEEAIKKIPEASIELIDLRTIVPLDFETILSSVKKTGRLLIVHEATAGFSVGSEIIRRVVEEGFDYLDAEPLVYGNLRTAMPFAANLEDAVLINPNGVLEKMRYLLTGIY